MKGSIVIIGAGELGMAFKYVLEKAGHGPLMWDIDEAKIPGQKPLDDIVSDAGVVFLCVPSWGLRAACESIRPFLSKETVVISLAKGLEQGTGKRADEVMEDVFGEEHPIAFIGGPMLAEEFGDGEFGFAVLASRSKAAVKVVSLFEGTNVKMIYTEDIRTVVLGGILKNVYAIALGVADGLGWNHNKRSWVTVMAVREMRQLIRHLGGDAEGAVRMEGLGDLIATGCTECSSHYRIGTQLAEKKTCSLKSEGTETLTELDSLIKEMGSQFPLIQGVRRLIIKREDASDIFDALARDADTYV
jgi:glycerol-3-phosphate dehydrogenase (NAD(P)+)